MAVIAAYGAGAFVMDDPDVVGMKPSPFAWSTVAIAVIGLLVSTSGARRVSRHPEPAGPSALRARATSCEHPQTTAGIRAEPRLRCVPNPRPPVISGVQGAMSNPPSSLATSRAKSRRPMEQLFSVVVFLVFLILWAAFAYALVANQGGLDAVWQWSRSLPLVVQAVIWLLTLPLAIGLWIWETGLPLVVRLVLVASIAGWNLWMFFPKDVLRS